MHTQREDGEAILSDHLDSMRTGDNNNNNNNSRSRQADGKQSPALWAAKEPAKLAVEAPADRSLAQVSFVPVVVLRADAIPETGAPASAHRSLFFSSRISSPQPS